MNTGSNELSECASPIADPRMEERLRIVREARALSDEIVAKLEGELQLSQSTDNVAFSACSNVLPVEKSAFRNELRDISTKLSSFVDSSKRIMTLMDASVKSGKDEISRAPDGAMRRSGTSKTPSVSSSPERTGKRPSIYHRKSDYGLDCITSEGLRGTGVHIEIAPITVKRRSRTEKKEPMTALEGNDSQELDILSGAAVLTDEQSVSLDQILGEFFPE